MLYDSLCPVCAWEIGALLARNRRGLLAVEDIAATDFDPARYGLTLGQVIGSMHAVTRDGQVLRGLDAFSAAYRVTGLTWLAKLIDHRLVRPAAALGYRLFARVRPYLSRFRPGRCTSGRCAVSPA